VLLGFHIRGRQGRRTREFDRRQPIVGGGAPEEEKKRYSEVLYQSLGDKKLKIGSYQGSGVKSKGA